MSDTAVTRYNAKKDAAERKIRNNTWQRAKKNYVLYLLLLPALIYIIIFQYIPLYGIQMAFRDYVPADGMWGSKWVGMKHFMKFFNSYYFGRLLKNTLLLSFYQLLAGFPVPVLLALVFNYATMKRMSKFGQTITFMPHFISTVVLVGMLWVFLSPTGIVNQFLKLFGGSEMAFLGESSYFRHIYVWSDVWQNMGWNAVIYITALTGVSQELHEAAIVDGASKIQRIRYVDFPVLLPTMVTLLILNTGSVLNVGFEKAYLMQNDINVTVSEIISTYVYKTGLLGAQFSYSTAIGLFNNVINFGLLLIVNRTSKKVSGTGLW